MAQRASGYARVADERYETPPEVTATIVPYLRRAQIKHIWESAFAPADKFGTALRAHGFTVTSTTTNFLFSQAPPAGATGLATNPPYGEQGCLAEAFIRHGLVLMRDNSLAHVVLLLPIDFDSAIGRARFFRDCPAFAHKIVLLGRIVWFAGGPNNPSTNHAWYCWDRDHRGPPTISYALVPARGRA
jgi:hypothetical protein